MNRMIRAFLGFDFRQRSICSADDDPPKGDDKGDDKGGGGGDDKIDPKIEKFVMSAVNGALVSHGKRQDTRFGEMLKTQLGEFAKTFKPVVSDDKPDDKPDDKGKGGKPDPAVIRLTETVEGLKSQLKAKDDENKAIQDKTKRSEERSALSGALNKLGIPEARAAGAIALLHTERQVVTRNDDGQIVMKVKRTYQGQASEELVPLEDGIAEWAKTEEGKTYMPAVKAGGSGERGGGPPKGKGEKPSTADALDTVARTILSNR